MDSMISESYPASLFAGESDKMFNFQHVFTHYSISHRQNLLKIVDVIDYSIKYTHISFYKVILCGLLTVVVYV